MNKLQFFTTIDFEKDYKRLKKKYRSLPNDLREFQSDFIKNPNMGIDLGNNLRKIRVAVKSKAKGKSGGARIILYNIVVNLLYKDVVLVSMYDKSETESLSMEHIKAILVKNGYK
jgi:hypothetical protein